MSSNCNQPAQCQSSSQQDDDCKVSPPKRLVEKLRDPTPPPIVKREVKRNSTPQGDTIERVRVTRQPQTIIERVTEQPRKPPPKIIERTEQEPLQPPIIKNICVLVDPTPRTPQSQPAPCQNNQSQSSSCSSQQQSSCAPPPSQPCPPPPQVQCAPLPPPPCIPTPICPPAPCPLPPCPPPISCGC